MNGFDQFRALPAVSASHLHFLCIGTDRSTGDALGPLVGSQLTRMGFSVTGTLEDPCHAMNIVERTSAIPSERIVIGIDAALGKKSKVGQIDVSKGPLRPGAGIGKELGSYGDYRIYGVVNVGGFMEYFVLQSTPLSLVLKMADQIVQGICSVYGPAAQVAAGSA